MGEIHELFVLALSLVWFAGATPDQCPAGQFRDYPTKSLWIHLSQGQKRYPQELV